MLRNVKIVVDFLVDNKVYIYLKYQDSSGFFHRWQTGKLFHSVVNGGR